MKRFYIIIAMLSITSMVGCKKFLDAKNKGSLAVPSTISDAQGLMDDVNFMNLTAPFYGEGSADNYYLTSDQFSYLAGSDQASLYIWGSDVFFNSTGIDAWSTAYGSIEKANLALETVGQNTRTNVNANDYDNAKGSALFFRGFLFWKIAATWAKAYNESTKDKDLGIPLRLSSDFNIASVRSNLSETYQQILKDLREAVPMLPKYSSVVQRPSKASAYGAMAEVFLSTRQYDSAAIYSDSFLMLNNTLLNYNTLDTNSFTPFTDTQNPEIVMYIGSTTGILYSGSFCVDSVLYRSYKSNDLRRSLFYYSLSDSTQSFKGSYALDGYFFSGISTDEIYLLRAECYARENLPDQAMKYLNLLLINRFVTGTFVPYTASSSQDALSKVLEERRKELVFRDSRWLDIKRLNLEGANISLTRFVNGLQYELPPNDNRFALPLPFRDIKLSGMQQNPR